MSDDKKKKESACTFSHLGCTFKGDSSKLDHHVRDSSPHHLALACNFIKQQGDQLTITKNRLSQEIQDKRDLVNRLDSFSATLDHLKMDFQRERSDREKFSNKLNDRMNAYKELHAFFRDEVQVQLAGIKARLAHGKSFDSSSSPPGEDVGAGGRPRAADGDSAASSPDPLSPNSSMPGSSVVRFQDFPKPLSTNPRLSHSDSDESLPSIDSLRFSNTQHHAEMTWKIPGFSKKLHRVVAGLMDDPISSEPVLTSPYGYKLSTWLYLNGRGKGAGRCASIYARIMHHDYDCVLAWPVRPVYTFVLLDQNPTRRERHDLVRARDLRHKGPGLERPRKEDKSVIVGFDEFILHDELQRYQYLLDDCLYLKVLVDLYESSD